MSFLSMYRAHIKKVKITYFSEIPQLRRSFLRCKACHLNHLYLEYPALNHSTVLTDSTDQNSDGGLGAEFSALPKATFIRLLAYMNLHRTPE